MLVIQQTSTTDFPVIQERPALCVAPASIQWQLLVFCTGCHYTKHCSNSACIWHYACSAWHTHLLVRIWPMDCLGVFGSGMCDMPCHWEWLVQCNLLDHFIVRASFQGCCSIQMVSVHLVAASAD